MKDFADLMDEGTPRDISEPVRLFASMKLVLLDLDSDSPHAQKEDGDKAISSAKVRALLMDKMNETHLREWTEMKLEGEVAEANASRPLAPNGCQAVWLTAPSCVNDRERNHAIRCQTNNINCEYNQKRWHFSNDDSCSRCGPSKVGSTSHVLNSCDSRLPFYGLRHDAGLMVLAESLKRIKNAQVVVDSTPHVGVNTSGTTQRPDIVLTRFKRVVILDLKCPYPSRPDHRGPYDVRVDNDNRVKYEHIAAMYRHKGFDVTLRTVIIPSTGPIPEISFNALCSAGLSPSAATKTLKQMSIATTRANFKLVSTLAPPRRPHSY
jgi:hypothetical protein